MLINILGICMVTSFRFPQISKNYRFRNNESYPYNFADSSTTADLQNKRNRRSKCNKAYQGRKVLQVILEY